MTLPQEKIETPTLSSIDRDRYVRSGLKITEDASCKRFLDTSYLVFEDGRVFNTNKDGFVIPFLKDGSYLRYSLRLPVKKSPTSVHRLVAITFKPNPLNDKVVNHLDGDKMNCHHSNLEWTTQALNIKHAMEMGLLAGRANILALSKPVIQLSLNGEVVSEFPSCQEASRDTGIPHNSISNCAKGGYYKKKKNGKIVWWNCNTAGGFRWQFKNAKDQIGQVNQSSQDIVDTLIDALIEVQAKAKRGIFHHLPVETMGAQMCIEIDNYINEKLASYKEKEGGRG